MILVYSVHISHGYYFAGTLAGEVDNPRKTFPLVLLILIPVVFVQTVPPLALALSIDQDVSNFNVGFYSTIARRVAGPWLADMITIGAIFSQVGLANGLLAISSNAHIYFIHVRDGHCGR